MCKQGEAPGGVSFVLTGCAQVFREPCTAEDLVSEITPTTTPPWFGELSALTKRPRSCTVMALGAVTIASISAEDLPATISALPELGHALQQSMKLYRAVSRRPADRASAPGRRHLRSWAHFTLALLEAEELRVPSGLEQLEGRTLSLQLADYDNA